jgi:hypothetical protein
MASSLDLSAASDVVNINLLIKRLQHGLNDDIIILIKEWLSKHILLPKFKW